MNAMGMRPGIILLREGTDTSQGLPQLISNINACQAVADAVRTTLGPAGRDKLVATSSGKVTISNDGATLMKLLEIAHPAAKTLVDISMSQDAVVGDGTTSVVLLAAEILERVKPFLEEGVHPQVLMKQLRKAGEWAVQKIRQVSLSYTGIGSSENKEKQRQMLIKTASTALNSKLIANHTDLFAPMVVEAVSRLHEEGSLDDLATLIAIKKIPGGNVRQSFLVQGGVAFEKTFSYAGFEQMTKKFLNPKILLLNVELELKSEKENAEVRISDPSAYQSFVDAEWKVIFDKLQACVDCGAHIVLSRLPIGDVATQYFADRGLFCAGRVQDADLQRVAKATRGSIQTSTTQLVSDAATILGTCGIFEERQVGDKRFNVFENCPAKLTSTLVLRGGTEQFIAESERSVHDALRVVQRSLQSPSVVAGGGAIEMIVSTYLQNHALLHIQGKGQLIVQAYAKALEVIPRQLCDNAGFESTDIMATLRKKHTQYYHSSLAAQGKEGDDKDNHEKWHGVDLDEGIVGNTFLSGVWEPADNKINSIQAATEAACVILSIDETIVAPRSQDPSAQASGMMGGGGGGGQPMSNMMGNAMQVAQGGGARSGSLGPGVSYMKGRGG